MTRGLIILDGADAAGKTTLAETIARIVGEKAVIRHLGKPDTGTAWAMHAGAICRYLEEAYKEDKLVIADRHWLSESIYGTCYRGAGEYPFAARWMNMLLARFGALQVVCAPPVETVVANHAKMLEVRHEDYKSGMDKIAQRYISLWEGLGHESSLPGPDHVAQLTILQGVQERLGWYRYDYSVDETEAYAHYLLGELRGEQWLVPAWQEDIDSCRFTGRPTARSVLLVGDQASVTNPLHLPFFSNNGSSAFLARTLHQLCVIPELMAIANVNDAHGPETVRLLANICGRTIVLGREAEKTMLLHEIPFEAKVRHPQHAARFSHHDDSYRRELFKALNGMAGARDVKGFTGDKL